MKLKAYAKVNLYLSVLSKRDDGYHDILSLMHNISLYDTIEIEEGKEYFVCNEDLKWDENNTIYNTLKLFEEKTGIHPKIGINLIKKIPMKGGLGGASTDAAAMLNYLCRRYSKMEFIYEIAKKVGSDVPFFIEGGCAIVKGRGESISKLKPLKLPLGLFFPKEGFSTPQMYRMVDEEEMIGKKGDPLILYNALKERNLNIALENTYNTFEELVKKHRFHLIEEARHHLNDYDIIAMTGSGSTFYGLSLSTRSSEKTKEGFVLHDRPLDMLY